MYPVMRLVSLYRDREVYPRVPNTKVMPGGVVIRNFPDGSQIITAPDGMRVLVRPDGTRQVLIQAKTRIGVDLGNNLLVFTPRCSHHVALVGCGYPILSCRGNLRFRGEANE